MTEAKHTPGPWSFIDNNWEVSTVYGPHDEVVAEVRIASDVDEGTQIHFEAIKEANARLISAAPHLFDALKATRGWVQIAASSGFTCTKALTLIDAAISKAEGRQ